MILEMNFDGVITDKEIIDVGNFLEGHETLRDKFSTFGVKVYPLDAVVRQGDSSADVLLADMKEILPKFNLVVETLGEIFTVLNKNDKFIDTRKEVAETFTDMTLARDGIKKFIASKTA